MNHDANSKNILAICGCKNSGKTTLIEKLVPILTERGYRIAYLKHDGHDFQADIKGTDSERIAQAGASSTAVFSKERYLIHEKQSLDFSEMIDKLSANDFILIEGGKSTGYPKLEIIRNGISDIPVSNRSGRLGILTDIPGFCYENENILPLDQTGRLADFCEQLIQCQKEALIIMSRIGG